jgi:hypothetical protein
MKRPVPVESASALIDQKIKKLGDWRGKTLAKVRGIVPAADPEIVEPGAAAVGYLVAQEKEERRGGRCPVLLCGFC